MSLCAAIATTGGGGGVSAFNPKSVGTLLLRLRADVGWAPGAWTDVLSGGGLSVVQASAPAQPTRTAVNASFNNKPTIDGDGLAQYLQGAFTFDQPLHVFIACKWNLDFVSADAMFDGAGNVKMLFYRSAAATINLNAGTGLPWTAATPKSPHVYALAFDGASGNVAEDNVSKVSGAVGAGPAAGLTLFRAGGAAFICAASIAEILVYGGHLSAPNATKVAHMLKVAYGTP